MRSLISRHFPSIMAPGRSRNEEGAKLGRC
jgi:hypothetical protein